MIELFRVAEDLQVELKEQPELLDQLEALRARLRRLDRAKESQG